MFVFSSNVFRMPPQHHKLRPAKLPHRRMTLSNQFVRPHIFVATGSMHRDYWLVCGHLV